MATVPSGETSYTGTTDTTVSFTDRFGYVLVTNNGTAPMYVTSNGSTPSSTGAGYTTEIAAGASALLANDTVYWGQASKVIPSGAVLYPNGSGAYQTTPNGQPGTVQPYMSSLAGGVADDGTVINLLDATAFTIEAAG